MRFLWVLFLGVASPLVACPDFADVPRSLSYPSPYVAGDPTKSQISKSQHAQMKAAVAPIDDALRALARVADELPDTDAQRCLASHLQHWAQQDGLAELQTLQARLTIGARLAGFAILARRLKAAGATEADLRDITQWLSRRAWAQVSFWEAEAPPLARRGNLRAWASLAVWVTGELQGSTILMEWARAGQAQVICAVNADGSLPIEMRRGQFSLHYQLHAVAPLVVLAAFQKQAQMPATCEAALRRAVEYALSDIKTGSKTAARTGVVQSYFNGTETFAPHELAWIEAYLTLEASGPARELARDMRPLRNSKLGGNQTKLWGH